MFVIEEIIIHIFVIHYCKLLNIYVMLILQVIRF